MALLGTCRLTAICVGCDAINTTVSWLQHYVSIKLIVAQLEVILSAAAMNLGMGWWTVATQGFTLANFYLTTWEEYHTGVRFFAHHQHSTSH